MALGESLEESRPDRLLVFVYGTLKRGFGNEWLMNELIASKHAKFVGMGVTQQQFPLVCGPFQVPFLLKFPSTGHLVQGELYSVNRFALTRLDELEGVAQGHYQRHTVPVSLVSGKGETIGITAEAYFAAPSYDHRLLNLAPHLCSYGSNEAAAYVPRRNRPVGFTFLDHVHAWIARQEEGVTLNQLKEQGKL